jgi:hypothetical protein
MLFKTDLSQFATKADLAHLATKAELHKELHLLTWRFLGLMIAQTGLILGAMYYMLSHPPQ